MIRYSKIYTSIALLTFIIVSDSCSTKDNVSHTTLEGVSSKDTTQVKVDSLPTQPIAKKKNKVISDPKKTLISDKIDQYRLRKYNHVTKLYQQLAQSTIELCVNSKVPPAAILAIVSLESGWGSGYVGQITGNILSLNATNDNAELPALYLPVLKKNGKVLYDPIDIEKYNENELEYQNRNPSLKKDYRPTNIAGTTKNLAYFKYHPKERTKAQVTCINDFITRFVSQESSIAAYREARTKMDNHVATGGIETLFSKEVNIEFINIIGGRPNTFNFRKTWPQKVETILNGAGLVEITKEMHLNGESFEDAW